MFSSSLWFIGVAVFGFGEPAGACCLSNGSCVIVHAQTCGSIDGTAAGGACEDVDGYGVADACERQDGELYWVRSDVPYDTDLFVNELVRSDETGKNAEVLAVSKGDNFSSFFVDVLGGHLYWTIDRFLVRAKLDGTDPGIVFEGTTFGVGSVLPIRSVSPDLPRRSAVILQSIGNQAKAFRLNLDTLEHAEILSDVGLTEHFVYSASAQRPCESTASIHDCDTDGDVDLRDFAAFQNAMTGP